MACSHTGSTCCNYTHIFRGQWDDYYLRALSCIEQGNFQQALSDFQESLERRPPSKQFDRRMVRTYGMHYLDYFPNRETGFLYFMENQYKKALEFLNRSIQSEPSAKAYYFRNQAQKKLQTSCSHPTLTLKEPFEIKKNQYDVWQSENELIIQGNAYDTQLIEKIMIQGKPFWIDNSAQAIAFSKRLMFKEGKHVIHIQAKNICGNVIDKKIMLHVDKTGPSISIQRGNQDETIIINAQDISGKLALIIDHKKIFSVNQSVLNYSCKWPSENVEIVVCAQDRCHNQTCATVRHAQLFHNPQISGFFAKSTNSFYSDADVSNIYPESDFINIEFDSNNPQTVFEEQTLISGKIFANRPIVCLKINNDQIPIQASKHIYFSRQIRLEAGQNQIHVTGKTISGKTKGKKIKIYRKIPSVLQLENRYGLSMYSFHVNGQENTSWVNHLFGLTDKAEQKAFDLTESFERYFFDALNTKKRFRINVRGQSQDNASKSFIPCQGSLLGNAYVSKFGLEITARIVDNQTSAVLGIKDVYRENKGKIEIHSMVSELSEKIHRSFPLIQGKIISKIENGYWFECKAALPKISWPMIVYRPQPDSDTLIIGNGSLTPGCHLNQMGMIVINDGEIKCGDWVISR